MIRSNAPRTTCGRLFGSRAALGVGPPVVAVPRPTGDPVALDADPAGPYVPGRGACGMLSALVSSGGIDAGALSIPMPASEAKRSAIGFQVCVPEYCAQRASG